MPNKDYQNIDIGTKVCSCCGMDHYSDVLKKERTQERIRILRKAVSLLCNGEPALINQAMCSAEKELFDKEISMHGDNK